MLLVEAIKTIAADYWENSTTWRYSEGTVVKAQRSLRQIYTEQKSVPSDGASSPPVGKQSGEDTVHILEAEPHWV